MIDIACFILNAASSSVFLSQKLLQTRHIQQMHFTLIDADQAIPSEARK
jgi:hypothetical protein